LGYRYVRLGFMERDDVGFIWTGFYMIEENTDIDKVDLMFCVGSLGESLPARRRGKAILDGLTNWEEDPVDITTFVESDEYLNLKGVVWPAVMDDLRDIFDVDHDVVLATNKFSQYQECVLDEAIGAGKSFISSIGIVYITYRLICLKNPQRFYKKAPGTLMAIMNMAPTATQAKNVVFGEIKARVDGSPWFKEFGGLDNKIKSVLRFNKGITILPGNSAETFPLGYSLIAWIMDEGAFYTDTGDHDVAQEIYYALYRRSQSRYEDRFLGIMISSPRYVDDFIERKMDEAKRHPGTVYSKRRALWESKPEDIEAIKNGETFELDGAQIPLIYKKTFDENPDKAWRDLGARPSLVLEPYFKQWKLLQAGVDNTMIHPADKDNKFFDWFVGEEPFTYYSHIDLALTGDACGLAVCHMDVDIIVIDLMLQIKPLSGKEIDLANVRSYIYEMQKRKFYFGKVTYDQFQSAESIQELNKRNISAERLSVDKDLGPYDTLKEMFYSGRVRCYQSDIFFTEARRLELIKGKKVDHPRKGSKDVTDAVAGAVFNCVQGEGSFGEMTVSIL